MNSDTHDSDVSSFQPDRFEAMYERVKTATKTRTQMELATLLSIRQSSVSDAKRRGSFPPDWVLKLMEEHHVNPNWIKLSLVPVWARRRLFPS